MDNAAAGAAAAQAQGYQQLADAWGLEHAPDSRAQLLHWLSQRLAWMLRHEPEALAQRLYRIDLDEAHFRQSLAQADPDAAAPALAEAVLARELKRLELRTTYNERFRQFSQQ